MTPSSALRCWKMIGFRAAQCDVALYQTPQKARQKGMIKLKRKLRRLMKRICVGLRASAHLDDTIRGKRDKFGIGAKVAVAAVATTLVAAPVKAQEQIGQYSWNPFAAIGDGFANAWSWLRNNVSPSDLANGASTP